MNGNDKKFFNERLAVLETRFSERWDNHDNRARELTEQIKEMRELVTAFPVTMLNHLKNLPCERHSERIRWIMRGLWCIVGGIIAVVIKQILGE